MSKRRRKDSTFTLEGIGVRDDHIWSLSQPVILLVSDNGPEWHSQVNCVMCTQVSERGYIIPMVHPYGMSTWGWDNCQYDESLGVIRSFVDQQEGFSDCQITEHMEAWVRAKCKFYDQDAEIVVTWENCD